MKKFFLRWRQRTVGNEWTFIVHGIFLSKELSSWGSIAYSYGMVSIIIQLTMAVAGYAVGMDCSPMASYSQSHGCRIHNGPSWCQDAEDIYLYFFGRVGFTTGSFLYPVAKIVEVTTGIPLTTAIFALGAFSMVYVALGGLRGVVVTDVLQFVILFAAVVIAVPLAFDKIGGVGTFFEKVPEGFSNSLKVSTLPGS